MLCDERKAMAHVNNTCEMTITDVFLGPILETLGVSGETFGEQFPFTIWNSSLTLTIADVGTPLKPFASETNL